MNSICKITTTPIAFGEDLGVGWWAARSCILADAILIPCSVTDAHFVVHGFDSSSHAAAGATAVPLVLDIPSSRIAIHVVGR
jgi:hypothetical protein